ncbi:MAG TPA: class I SAM-dependent methyltransferase [Gemmatimonadaceae bacterium]|nr:class I SAM-dependent methyltransferase [Gemmatimonadaceae bacterium]
MTARSTPSTNPNQALWEKGDFTRIAATMRESGEEIVARLGLNRDVRVLDLGCGDGTTAIPAARTGALVLGVDISRPLVEAGNKRAAELRLPNLKFEHGDATNLAALPDGAFDVVLSIFGAMFAPKPFDVAKEMVRVTRPRGRIIWATGFPTIQRSCRSSCASARPTRRRRPRDSSVPCDGASRPT